MLLKTTLHAFRNDSFVQSLELAFEVDAVEVWDDTGDLYDDWYWDSFGTQIRKSNPGLADCDLDIVDWSVEK